METLELSLNGGILTAKLSGDMDHHGVSEIREIIDENMYRHMPGILNMELSGVEFIDSSGLGLILGRYEKAREIGAQVVISNPSKRTKKLLVMTGIDKMLTIKEEVKK